MSSVQPHDMRVLLAGGGTGGHVFPALAVARELERRGCRVMWVGRPDGMERRMIEAEGLDYHALPARRWVGQGVIGRLRALLTLGVSVARARALVREEKIAVTVGTGGFVSVPAVVGTFLARRPNVLLEPNAHAGMANRWLSRLSAAACTGYENTGSELGCRAHWTGVPVRREFLESTEEKAGPPRVLIVGGSQGALQINRLLPPVVERLAQRLTSLRVLHQVGEAHLSEVTGAYEDLAIGGAEIGLVPFIDDMAKAMRSADVVISRAGALTLAEIVASGRPSILIPLAGAGGHQRANAQRLKEAGAAEVLDAATADSEHLAQLLGDLLDDHERRLRMAAAARTLSRPDAAARIADVVQELGRAA